MKAIVQDTYGGVEMLGLHDIDEPEVADDDVLVRVHAAGVDPSVWHLMTGRPYAIRLGFGLRRPKARVRGPDVAGRIVAVGQNVTRLQVGDGVFGTCNGSFAEYAVTCQDRVTVKPRTTTYQQAASVPTSAMTALQALRDSGRLQRGHRVLVIGAAGGVGSFAVQIAKAMGAQVTAGSRPVSLLRRRHSAKGTLVIVGGEGGGRLLGAASRNLGAAAVSPFVSQRLVGLLSKPRQADLESLRDLIEANEVTPLIDRAFPLHQAPEAVRYLSGGHARGKVVVTVAEAAEEPRDA